MKSFCSIFTVLLVAAPMAHAGTNTASDSEFMVLESHVGSRPRDADYLLDPLLDELTKHGFRSSSVTGTRINSQHSLTSEVLAAKDVKKAREAINNGYQAYIAGKLEGAIDECERGVELLMSRPATMVREQMLRDDLHKGLVVMSMANSRLSRDEALEESMGEFLRSFPDKDIPRASYGPEGVKLYHRLNKRLNEKLSKGTLQIAAGNGVMVYVNERHIGIGSQELELLPGRYRVYTQRVDKPGRVHLVDVEAGRKRTLVVDPALDAALRTDTFVGFSFPTEEKRAELEERAARQLGKAIGAKKIVLVGFQKVKGQDSIVVTMVEMERKGPSSAARVAIPEDSAPSAKQLRALAAFVVGDGPPTAAIEVLHTAPMVGASDDEAAPGGLTLRSSVEEPNSGISSAWRWTSWVAGGAAIGVGGYLISIDGDGTCELLPGQVACPDVYETLVPGIATAAGGVALGALGFYLWTKESDDEKPALSVVPTRGGFAVGLSGSF
jgi:hypothetical protein